jgi:hypothetical protein
MSMAEIYTARKNEILCKGKQVAVVLPSSGCTAKDAREMAAYAAQQMNHSARRKELRRAAPVAAPPANTGKGEAT